MRIIVVSLGIIFIVLAGCRKTETSDPTNNLKNCNVEYLFFRDDISFSEYETLNYPFVPQGSYTCSYIYQQGFIHRITGGFIPVPAGTNLVNYMFSDSSAYDSVYIGNNAFYVFPKCIYSSGAVFELKSRNVVYYLDDQNKLIKIKKMNSINPEGDELKYIYSDNQITEIVNDDYTRRKFYFENYNLVKVISEHYDNQGNLYSKKEILFQDYDASPNPFKNKYYIKGAFFRSFSENNYQGYTINKYERMTDSTFFLSYSAQVTIPLTYNSNGYPNFGDYE